MKRLATNETIQTMHEKNNEIKQRLNKMIGEKDPYKVIYKGHSLLTDNPSEAKYRLLKKIAMKWYDKLIACKDDTEREALLMSPSSTDNGTVGDLIGRIVDELETYDTLNDDVDFQTEVFSVLQEYAYEYVDLMNNQRVDNRKFLRHNPTVDIYDMKEAMHQVNFSDLTPIQMCRLYSDVEQFEHNTDAERISDIMLTLDEMGIGGVNASVIDEVFDYYDSM